MPVWTIPYDIYENEYIEFNKHYVLKHPAGRKSMLPWKLLGPVIFFLGWLFSFVKDKDIVAAVIGGCLYLIVGVIWWFNCYRILLKISKMNLKNKHSLENALFSPRGVLTFDFPNRIIVDSGKLEELKIPFDTIERFYEAETAFYLYYRQAKGLIIPYRLFRTADDCYAFGQLLRRSFPPAENK